MKKVGVILVIIIVLGVVWLLFLSRTKPTEEELFTEEEVQEIVEKELDRVEDSIRSSNNATAEDQTKWLQLRGYPGMEYPQGWHVYTQWDAADINRLLFGYLDPNPINIAPRDGPLATIVWNHYMKRNDESFENPLAKIRENQRYSETLIKNNSEIEAYRYEYYRPLGCAIDSPPCDMVGYYAFVRREDQPERLILFDARGQNLGYYNQAIEIMEHMILSITTP